MSPRIEVLVVIVSYRTARLALRCLASLAEEAASPELELSVVIVENASGEEDELARGMNAYPPGFARLVRSPVNGGFGAGNNLGVRAAHEAGLRPAYVHFLNPDTEVRPGAIRTLVRFLEEHPRAGLASGTFEHRDGTPWPIVFRFPSAWSELESACGVGLVTRLLGDHVVPREVGAAPERIDWCSGASMMVRREVLERVGGFDEAFFLYFEEIDLCLRMKDGGWESWCVPESRVMHVRGQSTGVTALDQRPKRLPRYWYESRRRYFAKHHGFGYAALADAAVVLGRTVGTVRDALKGVPRTPRLVRDLVQNSAIWGRNRQGLSPARVYFLPPVRGGDARLGVRRVA
jgi:N-acetylglucosaminyl-diphospho-decaprenol L-rhamnosyltransferase